MIEHDVVHDCLIHGVTYPADTGVNECPSCLLQHLKDLEREYMTLKAENRMYVSMLRGI